MGCALENGRVQEDHRCRDRVHTRVGAVKKREWGLRLRE
jgi:hypothetical protein